MKPKEMIRFEYARHDEYRAHYVFGKFITKEDNWVKVALFHQDPYDISLDKGIALRPVYSRININLDHVRSFEIIEKYRTVMKNGYHNKD